MGGTSWTFRRAAVLAATLGATLIAAVAIFRGHPSPPRDPLAESPRSVSAVIALRDAGWLGSQAITMAGFWSDDGVAHFCAFSTRQADLDSCRSGEYGFTEQNEPLMVVARDGTIVARAKSPMLQPWIINPAAASVLYAGSASGGDPPLPVVVLGHFNDRRAAACQPEDRPACRAGFVVDAVVSVNGRLSLPNIPSRALFEHGPLQVDVAALQRVLASVQRSGERLIGAVVADGWNGSVVDRSIRFKLPGATWFVTFLEPDGTIRTIGADQTRHTVIWTSAP